MKNTPYISDGETNYSTQKKAECFIKVFGEAPWNEGRKSMISNKVYSLSTKDFGDDIVEPFYDKNSLSEQRKERSKKQGYVEVLIESLSGSMVGFALGWETELEKLNNEKLQLSKNDIDLLEKKVYDFFPRFTKDRFFYNADFGLLPEARGIGLGSGLYKKRLEKVLNNGLQYALVRTTKRSDKPYKWYLNMGYKEVFSYGDEQERVILVANLLG